MVAISRTWAHWHGVCISTLFSNRVVSLQPRFSLFTCREDSPQPDSDIIYGARALHYTNIHLNVANSHNSGETKLSKTRREAQDPVLHRVRVGTMKACQHAFLLASLLMSTSLFSVCEAQCEASPCALCQFGLPDSTTNTRACAPVRL